MTGTYISTVGPCTPLIDHTLSGAWHLAVVHLLGFGESITQVLRYFYWLCPIYILHASDGEKNDTSKSVVLHRHNMLP